MTIQEKIREGINQYLTKQFICDEDREVPEDEYLHEANALLAYLHSQGVVIRVDRELPDLERTILLHRDTELAAGELWIDPKQLSVEIADKLRKAGYGAFEQLI